MYFVFLAITYFSFAVGLRPVRGGGYGQVGSGGYVSGPTLRPQNALDKTVARITGNTARQRYSPERYKPCIIINIKEKPTLALLYTPWF